MGTMTSGVGYGACPRCPAGPDQPCLALGHTRVRRGEPIVSVHTGRMRVARRQSGRVHNEEIADRRLAVWWRRARLGDPVDDIAAELRMTRAALDQYVLRARKRGHRRAVYHAAAQVKQATRARNAAV